jgi:dTDP-4-amino-4,6-dideoxy-D-galactose acyltransferase
MNKGLYLDKLNWDTDFFGFNVGFLRGSIQSEKEQEEVIEILEKTKTKLAYYASAITLPAIFFTLKKVDVKFVDEKTTFFKKIDSTRNTDSAVVSADNFKNLDVLRHLSILSGRFSRFNVDKNIPNEKFEELYLLWLKNSLNKKIAKEVLLYVYEEEIAGFVTLGEKNGRGDIGIIAVAEQYQGKGIGRKLMQSAEHWFLKNGYTEMQVVTQGSNLEAKQLYTKTAFQIESVEFFYHIWQL